MDKALDIIICLGLNILMFMIWGFKMLVTGDIPVQMSIYELLIIVFVLISLAVSYNVYFRKTRYIILNILLLLLLLYLWYMTAEQAWLYNYQNFDTLASVLGFIVTATAFTQIFYRKLKSIRSRKS